MKKHLHIRAKLVANNTKVELTLLGQTHFTTGFGSKEKEHIEGYSSYGPLFFLHERVRLYSYGHFAFSTAFGSQREDLWLELPDSRTKVDTNPVTYCPPEHYQRIKKAIEAYNAWGALQGGCDAGDTTSS